MFPELYATGVPLFIPDRAWGLDLVRRSLRSVVLVRDGDGTREEPLKAWWYLRPEFRGTPKPPQPTRQECN